MTQRVAWAIVLVTWAVLALGGAAAYLAIRQTLLDALDASLIARAAALPRLIGVDVDTVPANDPPAAPHVVAMPPGDRYLVRTELGRTIARSDSVSEVADAQPSALERQTAVFAGRQRLRSVALEVGVTGQDGAAETVTVVYSSPMDAVDKTLGRLVILLVTVGGGSGLAAVVAAQWVARRAMKPVAEAAEVLSRIDEPVLGSAQNRQRRVVVETMPLELQPIGLRVNQMLDRLDAGAAERRQFLADAAHELRTPVAGLLTTLELLLWRPREPDQVHQMLGDALNSAQAMRQLVEALLEHARGELQVREVDELAEINVVEVVEECIRLLAASARSRGLQIVRRGPSTVSFHTSASRLRSIVQNLLSNAIAYAPEGEEVIVQVRLEDEVLYVSVSNGGSVIAADDLPHLFKPFYRGKRQAGDPGLPHHGLGLYFVQSHVAALGGKVEVKSNLQSGTVFEVWLPAAIPDRLRRDPIAAAS